MTARSLIGLDPLHLDHDRYPLWRWQPRCYCGRRKSMGLLTCGHHGLDRAYAEAGERFLGGEPRVYQPTFSTAPRRTRYGTPTPQQIEARDLMQEGLTEAEIARRLGISPSVVHGWFARLPPGLAPIPA